MRKKKIHLFISAWILLTFITSCNAINSPKDNLVQFDTIKVEKTAHLFNNENKPACHIEIQYVYPKDFYNKAILKIIQQKFNGKMFGKDYTSLSPQEAVDKYINQYIAEYKKLEKGYYKELKLLNTEDRPDNPSFSYEESLGTSIGFIDEEILSFTADSWGFTGGAHGFGGTGAYVINLKTGDLLEEKDVFADGMKEKIRQLILSKLMKDYEVSSLAELENAGFFDVKDIHPNNNFTANDEGITYIYNQYEIAPYSMGSIEVFLPYEEIITYMKKDCPLTKFVKN